MTVMVKSVIMHMLRINMMLGLTENNNGTALDSVIQHPSNSTSCYFIYSQYVCFPLGKPWAQEWNKLANAPFHVNQMKTKIFFYQKHKELKAQTIDPTKIRDLFRIPLSKGKHVRIVTHGYISSCTAVWAKHMVTELLKTDDNIFCVQWTDGAQPPYTQAIANIRLVGVQLGYFIYLLTKYLNVDPSSINIVGHSLGSHLAGHAGEYLQKTHNIKIGRITGLDPAGPFFVNTPPEVRLDTSDASYVDVLHTDDTPRLWFPLSVGINSSIGHADFYPNGGKDQTGCTNRDIKCHHVRANYLYSESIRQSCPFVAINCSSYEEFLKGECWDCQKTSCAVMGIKSSKGSLDESPKKFFLLTHPNSPYCGSHYRITVQISNSASSILHGGEFASIEIRIFGPREHSELIQFSDRSKFFRPGSTHREVVLTYDVGEIDSIDMMIRYATSIMNPMSWRLQAAVLHVSSISVDQLSTGYTWIHEFETEELKTNIIHSFKMERENAELMVAV